VTNRMREIRQLRNESKVNVYATYFVAYCVEFNRLKKCLVFTWVTIHLDEDVNL
jgi:hypothetical protein